MNCGQSFTDLGWENRHDVNDLDADQHAIELGEYHDDCCPLPSCAPDHRPLGRRPERLPFANLHQEAGLENFSLLAARIGRSPRTLHRWKNSGVPLREADTAAIRIGSHPSYVWPQQWHQLEQKRVS